MKNSCNLIIITNGKNDRGSRATIGFCLAVSSIISNIETVVFLTLDGTCWAKKGAVRDVAITGFEPLETYIKQFTDAGGKILVCSPCTKFFCATSFNESDLIEGAEFAGFATIAEIMEKSSVATF